ncbi:MAG TPA: matrixin family metalloprotease [Casimicrobiaceae bacterium]|nr:matrixin family metalloprotease [Casimicrobiaceae bacterium]
MRGFSAFAVSVATCCCVVALGASSPARAGGPIAVVNQQAVVYPNGGTSITLNLDRGSLGSRTNAQATALVQAALGMWNGVSTSTMRLNIGPALVTDYTLGNYLNVYGNYSDGVNPVIFDTDGSITDAILGVGQKLHVVGFAGSAYFTSGAMAGKFAEGNAVLNGYLNVSDTTLTNTVAHELGHFVGLDHSQLDSAQGLPQSNYVLMYPIIYRTQTSLHEDDVAAITALYPAASATSAYGQLDGTFTTVGGTPVLGANLWAMESSGKVYSVVSDFLAQGSGYFHMWLPPGTYTLHAEAIHSNFYGGSSVGPYANTPGDLSFQPPNPIAPVTLGGGAGVPITITGGCLATATFRVDGSGSVSGNCNNVASGMPGAGTIINNPYGGLSVQGGSLVGSTVSNLQPNAVIQLGNTSGSAGSYAEIDFQGLGIAGGNTLTLRSGAPGQTILLYNVSATSTSIGGTLFAQGGNGAPPPGIILRDPNGVTIAAGGTLLGTSGLQINTLGSTPSNGQTLTNAGVVDGGASLQLRAAKIGGSGAFKGNAVVISTFGNANNPVNGLHFLSNGLQLYPSSGSNVALTLNDYGASPQVLNVMVNGNAFVTMSSVLPALLNLPPNNAPLPLGAIRAAGVAAPSYGGGSMIVQATGSMTLQPGASNDFAFPGSIVLKAGGTLDAMGVNIDNGWTTTGQSFQGVYFEAPIITNSGGNLQAQTNDLNWINFSTMPSAHVRTWRLVRLADGTAQFQSADSIAPHLNTYSVLIEANANGQCYVCLVSTAPINVQ